MSIRENFFSGKWGSLDKKGNAQTKKQSSVIIFHFISKVLPVHLLCAGYYLNCFLYNLKFNCNKTKLFHMLWSWLSYLKFIISKEVGQLAKYLKINSQFWLFSFYIWRRKRRDRVGNCGIKMEIRKLDYGPSFAFVILGKALNLSVLVYSSIVLGAQENDTKDSLLLSDLTIEEFCS